MVLVKQYCTRKKMHSNFNIFSISNLNVYKCEEKKIEQKIAVKTLAINHNKNSSIYIISWYLHCIYTINKTGHKVFWDN